MGLLGKLSNSASENIKVASSKIATSILVSLAILWIARLCCTIGFALTPFLQIKFSEKLDFLVLSTRFDLKVVSIAYIPAVLLALATFFKPTFFKIFTKVFKYYSFAVISILVIFSVINYFYFKTYDKCIDTFIFAASKEDPVAVLKTVIQDYPLFRGLIGLCVLFFVLKYIYKKIEAFICEYIITPERKLSSAAFILVTILSFAGFARGSFGTFPLRQLHAQVCDKSAVNYNIPNGILAFQWAYKWNKLNGKIPVIKLEKIADDYHDLGIEIKGKSFDDLVAPLKHTTHKNKFLEGRKPNIVFSVMEGMSSHLLSFDDEHNRDLLGSLRQHANEDFFFDRFLSEGDGTSDSLTRIFLGVPDLNLSTSTHADKNYITNIVRSMKKAGYKTIFVTASTASWRNYHNFLHTIGFDEVVERSQVALRFPNATQNTWGIDDEFLFKEALRVLKEDEHDKPIFLMTLSITNHPPFVLPKNYTATDMKLTPEMKARFPYPNIEVIFNTFKYANDMLGKFITAIKMDPKLKDNTFIAAVGDHNIRGIGYTQHPDELFFGHQVPLYIYMPSAYLENTNVSYDKHRYGSQKDIMTTLISHALSDFTFYSFGCDLLSDDKCNFPYAYNQDVIAKVGEDYVCNLNGFVDANAYKITSNDDRLLVDPQRSNDDCTKALGLKRLEQDLYFYQANQ